jgi:hypothetical protein
LLSLFEDFENWSDFKPRDIHQDNLKALFVQLENWSESLKTLRV